MADDEWLTTAAAAELLEVDPSTLWRWTKASPPKINHRLTAGGHRQFRRSEVERLAAALAQGGVAHLPPADSDRLAAIETDVAELKAKVADLAAWRHRHEQSPRHGVSRRPSDQDGDD